MKLLVDGRSIGAGGGIGRATRNLVLALAAARPDWHVTVATSGASDFEPPAGASLEVRDLGVWRARGSIPNLAARALLWPSINLRRHARRSNADCLWCSEFYAPLPPAGAPIVLSIYDLRFFELPLPHDRVHRLWTLSVRRAIAASAKRARAIVVPSDYVAGRVGQYLDLPVQTELLTLPLGVTPPPAPAPTLPAGVAEPFVLSVGAEPWRGNAVVAQALSRLADDGIRLSLVVVGPQDGRRQGPLAPNVTVRHLGAVPDPVLWALYGRATALCVASTVEGFGLPALEAMSTGTPVVAADAAALPEVVGDGGIVVAPGDVPQWHAALKEIATDSRASAGLAEAARRRAARFTWEESGRRLAELVERVRTP